MKVYRYEDKDGIGPYSSSPDFAYDEDGELYERMIEKHNWELLDNHPGMRTLVRKGDVSRYKSATVSRKALTKWFWGYNAMLQRAGYKVVEYNVDKRKVVGPDHVGQVAARL